MFCLLQAVLNLEMEIKVIMNSNLILMLEKHIIWISKAQCFLMHYGCCCLKHSCVMFHLSTNLHLS